MEVRKKYFLPILVIAVISMQAINYSAAKDVRVRLHVPKHIKTIYKTKIIKVPEHHHYIHHEKKEHEELEPLKVPEYHHFFHDQNEKLKNKYIRNNHNHRYDDSDEDDKKLTLEEVRLILENAGRLARYGNYKRYHIDPNKK